MPVTTQVSANYFNPHNVASKLTIEIKKNKTYVWHCVSVSTIQLETGVLDSSNKTYEVHSTDSNLPKS
jgi:hypothetical protein